MRKLLAILVLVGTTTWSGLGMAVTASHNGVPQSDWMNETAIRKLYEEFNAAWNRHDVKTMAKMWAIDGDHLEPDGRVAKGRGEVETLLANQHKSIFKDTKLALTIDSVWFISSTVALIDGSYELSGARMPDGKELPARKGHLTSVLMYEDSKWWIAASRLMIPIPLPYKK